jgi:ubiquitin-conjugating enzyme E2 variant
VHENRIYSVQISCGEKYPQEPPIIRFVSRVNLPFVNQTSGVVDRARLPVLTNWNEKLSIENVLVEIRRCVVFFIWGERILMGFVIDSDSFIRSFIRSFVCRHGCVVAGCDLDLVVWSSLG